jgi:hypothetical protein
MRRGALAGNAKSRMPAMQRSQKAVDSMPAMQRLHAAIRKQP